MNLVSFLFENMSTIMFFVGLFVVLIVGFWLAIRSQPVMPPMKSVSRAEMMKYEQDNF